jgi:hypothetical protein
VFAHAKVYIAPFKDVGSDRIAPFDPAVVGWGEVGRSPNQSRDKGCGAL